MLKNKGFDPDHFYYNVTITHDDINYGYRSSPCVYTSNTNEVLVQRPSDYYISIVRFSVDGQTIPINEFRTDLTVTLYYNNTTAYMQPVVYVPTYANANPNTDIDYYFIYSYQAILNMFNTALAAATLALNTANPGTLSFAPFYTYNSATQLFSLVVPYSGFSTGLVTMWLNTPAFEDYLGIGFNAIKVTTVAQPDGRNFQLITDVYPGNTNGYAFPGAVITNPPAALIYTQEYVSITNMNAFKNLIFATATIPIVSDTIPSQGQINLVSNPGNAANLPLTDNGSSSIIQFFPSITDFEPLLVAAGDSRQQLQYYPQGPYRYVDMISESALSKIDIRIYWEDKKNKIYQHNLAVGQVATIKLLFRKKKSFSESEREEIEKKRR